jgi:hypothetical protein
MVMNGRGIELFQLQEFRLSAADTDGAVARIVGSSHGGVEPPVPLLTSIEDRRNVAVIRAVHADESRLPDAAQRIALEPFVSSWSAPTEYSPRISERSGVAPSSYRLAVTESGINEAETGDALVPEELGVTSTPAGLLWIGQPLGTHAGLLVLLGNDEKPSAAAKPAARNWPLPLSRFLGVRIYEGG